MTAVDGAGPNARVSCPHCAEQILPSANVCRFCGRELNGVHGTTEDATLVKDEAAMTRAVSSGVLRAVAVVAVILLVGALIIALVVKRGSMQESADRCDEVLNSGGLPPGASSLRVLARANSLGQCAGELRQGAKGVLASIAGSPRELEELAARTADESERLTGLAALLAAHGS